MDKALSVKAIQNWEAEPWVLRKHYARRIPPISYAFGLYQNNSLIGVVTYGVPSSRTLCRGICGDEFTDLVLELNRLVLEGNAKNHASVLVSRSLKLLPKPRIIVSYADTGQGHVGYVYQATNFIYTGLLAKRTDWKIKGMEHLHGQTIADMSRSASGGERGSRAKFLKSKFGDDFYLQDRSRKHRYIFFVGSKKEIKIFRQKLKYDVQSYPKGESKRYDSSANIETQIVLL